MKTGTWLCVCAAAAALTYGGLKQYYPKPASSVSSPAASEKSEASRDRGDAAAGGQDPGSPAGPKDDPSPKEGKE